MRIALFFGSFNPVHIGHLIIANFIIEKTDLQKVWFVVSPHNPLKEKKNLLNQYHRLHLVRLAIEGNTKFKASDIEFKLPQPSYTIDTLTYLKEKYPQHTFSIIMGSDNLSSIHKWKNYELLLKNYHVYVYQRSDSLESEFHNHPNVTVLDVPMLDISATMIREMITEKKSVRYILPDAVNDYITANNYYKKT